jgi:hypothetical protein
MSLAGWELCCFLSIVFLPQIVSSKIGRNLIKSYLESKYRGTAWVGEMHTSWFGGTSVAGFSLIDPEGRAIKFARLDSGMTLGGLLTGNFELKNATIKDLSLEYVIDYGDGSDSFDRMAATWVPNAVTPTPAASKPRVPMNLPDLSGNIKLENATVILTRGQISDKMFRQFFRSSRFSNINGTVQIASLDEPWKCDLNGNVGGEDTGGTFKVSGEMDLGEDGLLNLAKATANLTVTMRDIPNAATPGSGSLGWVLLSLVPAEDYAQMFGPVIKTLDMHLTVGEGKVRFDKFSAVGKLIRRKRRWMGIRFWIW